MGVFDDADAQLAAQRAAQQGTASVPPGTLFADPVAPPQLDKYQQAAVDEYDRNPAIQARTKGIEGYSARIGMGIPWSDEIMAGLNTPFEMVRQGTFDPREGYSYAKARENLINDKTRENTPGGFVPEILGALATGGGALGGTRTAATALTPQAIKTANRLNYQGNIGRGLIYGAAAGAGEGDTLQERSQHLLAGGALGGALGAVADPLIMGAQWASRAAQLPRLRDPEKIATEQVAKVVRDAGLTTGEVADRVAAARAAGQTDFTAADAIGHAAERKLDALHKVPGPARERIAETLTGRDINMPDRVGEMVGRKLNAPDSALASREGLIDTAGREAGPLYREAEGVTTWSPALQEFWNHPDVQQGLQRGIRRQQRDAVGTGAPFNPQDYAITHFNEAGDAVIGGVPNMRSIQAAKVGLDEMINANRNDITGRLTAEGASLAALQRRMLEHIDSINPVYRDARRAYGGPMQVEEAVRTGQQWPTQGRAVDNVAAYNEMNPFQQQGIRIGVADRVRGDLERTGNIPTYLRGKSQKGQTELEAISPYGPATLREMLAREEQMQRLNRGVTGGSQTAGRLADIAQGPGAEEALGIAGHLATGNKIGAARGAIDVLKRVSTGENEAQRSAIARLLLANEPDAIRAMQQRIDQHELRRRGVNPFVSRPPRYPVGQ